MKTQNQHILSWLESGKSINAIQALNHFGVFRLSARIANLKDQGFKIETKVIRRNNKNVADYKLK